MRKVLISFLICVGVAISGNGQTDSDLTRRIDSMMLITVQGDVEKMLDFTYPGLFTLAPREEVREAMVGTFETAELKTTIDSAARIKLHPVFEHDGGSYTLFTHSLVMRMVFKAPIDAAAQKNMVESVKAGYPGGSLRFDAASNALIISTISSVVGIKDAISPEWTFLTYSDGSDLLTALLDEELLTKLKEYK